MQRIAIRGAWMMVDGFNTVEGPDRRGYVEIFSWHDEEPPEALNLPGIPVSVDETCEAFAHAGREWLFLTPAPPPVSDRKMPGT